MCRFRGYYPNKKRVVITQQLLGVSFNEFTFQKNPGSPQPILHSLQCLLLQLHAQSVDKCIPGVVHIMSPGMQISGHLH